MVFSSAVFLFVFLPVTFCIYFLLNDRYKNVWLLLTSLVFYSWGEPKYIVLINIEIILNYSMALIIKKVHKNKIWVAVTICVNLLLLFYFKYFDFALENINGIFGTDIALKNIALPIGISFYTFQGMSYVIDVYRGDAGIQKNILNLGLYLSFFPQLIAGPIVRYADIEKWLHQRTVTTDSIYSGIRRFMSGFSKKILVADQLAPLADAAFAGNGYSAPLAWTGAIAYTLQIYFDFSGYSDMAIGLGKIFGFDFPVNFNFPYISGSIKEFWRRWHISLSTWFRDYVYIPMGGSRRSSGRTYFNLFVVFLLTGIWHGASWNFVVWGLYYVCFLIMERMNWGNILKKLPRLFQHAYAMTVIIIGWVFFRADDLGGALMYIKNMFTITNRSGIELIANLNRQYIFCLIAGVIFSMPVTSCVKKIMGRFKVYPFISGAILLFIFCVAIAYMVGSGFSPFLYFRF